MHTMDWTSTKARFNHDWLKNRASVAINALLQQARSGVNITVFGNSQLRVLEEWTERRLEALSLIDRFPTEMSPAVLFKQAPLCFCGTTSQSWMAPLILEIWRDRCHVEEWTVHARNAVGAVDYAISAAVGLRLDRGLPGHDTVVRTYDYLLAVAEALRSLSALFSDLPRQLP